MKEIHKKSFKKYKSLFRKVSEILYLDWDPIDINAHAPKDEYDNYVPGVIELLLKGKSEQEITNHLVGIEKKFMNQNSDPKSLITLAIKLIKLDLKILSKS